MLFVHMYLQMGDNNSEDKRRKKKSSKKQAVTKKPFTELLKHFEASNPDSASSKSLAMFLLMVGKLWLEHYDCLVTFTT